MGDAENRLSRRDLLLRAAAGAAAAMGSAGGLGTALKKAAAAGVEGPKGMRYRTLGRTKLRVSELSLGAIRVDNLAVVNRALDLGINYFDTAECYQEGNSEIKLGKALKGRREGAIVATKWHTEGDTPYKDLLASLDGSLGRLGMDHVELIQVHGAGSDEQVTSDELWEAFTRAREAGKVRFNGISTHSNQARMVEKAIETGRFDAVLVSYNAVLAAPVGPAMAAAHKANVGTIAMKVLQPAHEALMKDKLSAFRGNPYQQAIQWMLSDGNVSTSIVDMPTFEELEEDYKAVGMAMTRAESQEFERTVALVSAGSCHLCGSCTGQCPRGVQVAEVMRYALYHDGYGDRERARELYRGLPTGETAQACGNCSQCKVVCPWGVAVRGRLERAHAAMA